MLTFSITALLLMHYCLIKQQLIPVNLLDWTNAILRALIFSRTSLVHLTVCITHLCLIHKFTNETESVSTLTMGCQLVCMVTYKT